MEQALRSGTTLRGDSYRIDRILGQGDFGITYLALDINLDRKIAIKEFFPKEYCYRNELTGEVLIETSSIRDFINELEDKFLNGAIDIAHLDHQGIIKIHDAFRENNTAYYVMDYIEGDSLHEKVMKNGPLSPNIALRYINKVGNALAHMHSKGINHLDVKPANIIVRDRDDTPILLDFGQYKKCYLGGYHPRITSNISYGFSPLEKYINEENPQMDIYSLASTLYFILTGEIPPGATELMYKELTFPSDFSGNIEAPIRQAMNCERNLRQPTVQTFCNQLMDCNYSDEDTIFEQSDSYLGQNLTGNERFSKREQNRFKNKFDKDKTIIETERAGTYQEVNKSKSWKEMNRQEKIETLKKEWRLIVIAIICMILVFAFFAIYIYSNVMRVINE